MSVLIKGMRMPKEGCKDCMMVQRGGVSDICPFLKQEVNGNVERGGKPNGCPIVEVPNMNVGDTIYRQAAIEALSDEKGSEEYHNEYEDGYNDGIDFAISTLSTLSPAQKIGKRISGKRVSGKWVDQYQNGDWHCSCCGAIVEKEEQMLHNWYFCYHCGAEMVERRDDG